MSDYIYNYFEFFVEQFMYLHFFVLCSFGEVMFLIIPDPYSLTLVSSHVKKQSPLPDFMGILQ